MEEWEAVKADAGSVVTSVDTNVDTDVDHTDGELDAEDAAEAVDSATGIVRAAASGAEPEDEVAAAAFGAGDVPERPRAHLFSGGMSISSYRTTGSWTSGSAYTSGGSVKRRWVVRRSRAPFAQ